MGSFSSDSDDDIQYRFFDAQESIASVSDSSVGCSRHHDSDLGVENWGSFEYDVWLRSPSSVRERRRKFHRWMGVNLNRVPGDDCVDACGDMDVRSRQIDDRVMQKSGAVLRNSNFEDEFSSSQSTESSWSTDALDSLRELGAHENLVRNWNSDCRRECNVNDLVEDCKLSRIQAVGLNHIQTPEGFENSSGVQPVAVVQEFTPKEIEGNGNNAAIVVDRLKSRWLHRIRSMTCMMLQPEQSESKGINGSSPTIATKVQRVKVRNSRKQLKELSALFKGQDIQAHDGSILTMKFSLDGQYLASAGEDKIVRVWQVVEDERANETDIPDIDPSCLYFTVNHLSELAPLMADKEKFSKLKNLKKTSDSACIIFPPKIFRILEEPLHVFQGHTAEVLDLSWSKNNCLLSSSVDKTVRLWRVGNDQCLKVFPHSNYVTCAQFNPVNDDYFVTGSIDGKVRIWEISARRVVDWTDIKDIITAVCYRPDGQGGIIGSMTGTCRFFTVSGDRLQVEAQMCLTTKKKSPCKRITSFQFFPEDLSKVMVTCADSQVRILCGNNVIRKYRGPRNSGNQISASFTSDGKHIISASEDFNVYIWKNSFNLDDSSPSQSKNVRSFECFSGDASVAIPWFGLKRGDNIQQFCGFDQNSTDKMSFSPTCFSLGQEFFLEAIPRGSATWPEEKLLASGTQTVASIISKSDYKFLRTSFQSSSSSHAWGMVIVTAGWDGRIRSFHNYGLPTPV
ncbi:hypothetical protein ACH5RR_017263 [Cinchona calisaya]|uniref:Transducin/WD40 repeat-like superfamily protein n=1 Tax=Cinchona calisaya TaxID=153742 RepID=A0ABD2ZY92_9GENT